MSEFHQQRIYIINHLGKEETLGTFWLDEEGLIDPENLPSKLEMAKILQLMRVRKVCIESTGNFFKEDE